MILIGILLIIFMLWWNVLHNTVRNKIVYKARISAIDRIWIYNENLPEKLRIPYEVRGSYTRWMWNYKCWTVQQFHKRYIERLLNVQK